MAIRVVIDTSVLRRDPKFASGPVEALSRFAEAGYVEVYVPDVVAEEFKLLPSAKIEAVAGLKETLRRLRKNSPDELHAPIAEFEMLIASGFEELEKRARGRFEQWIRRIKATITPVGEDHGAKVLAKYFDGTLPFARPKARDDFPDAFIAENVADLATNGEIFVIVADGRLAAALEDVEGALVFESVKELLESDEFDDLRTDVEADNVVEIVKVFDHDRHLFKSDVEDAIETDLSGSFVSYRNPSSDEKEGDEELYVESAEVLSWQIDKGSAEYLGEGVISVGFSASVAVAVDRSTGNEYEDDLHGSSQDLTVECDGIISIIIDREDLRAPNVKWSGVHLTNVARIEVEEINTSLAQHAENHEY